MNPSPGAKAIQQVGLPLLEAALIHIVFLKPFKTLCSSMVREGLDWTGEAQLVELLVLTDQMAHTKCRSRYLEVPSPTACF